MPDLTVSIVLYNSRGTLPELARSLAEPMAQGLARVVAVDNASADGSAEAFSELLPEAKLIRNPENLGYAVASNQAWEYVRGRYWLLLNPDIRTDGTAIRRLVAWMDERPDVGVASPLLRGVDGTEETVARPLPNLGWRTLEIFRLHRLMSAQARSRHLMGPYWQGSDRIRGWVPGAAMIARREAVEVIGLLNDRLFMYGEDLEWCWRMCRGGWSVGLCRDAAFVHLGGTSARSRWTPDEIGQRIATSELTAVTALKGRTWAVLYKMIIGVGLALEGLHPLRSRKQRQLMRRSAGAWLRGAKLGIRTGALGRSDIGPGVERAQPSPSRRGSVDLVLLTSGYPFDNWEPVLDPEMAVLAKRFARIFVVPSLQGQTARNMPSNAILEQGRGPAASRPAKLRALATSDACRVLVATLRRPRNWRPYLSGWRHYLDILAISVLKAKSLEGFVRRHQLTKAIFYDYWLENGTLALALLRRRGVIRTAVSRAHNFDIYDELWPAGRVPFQEFKARWLDSVFPISDHGARYLGERIPALRGKMEVARLGVDRQSPSSAAPSDVPLIVSCSRVEPHKRVHLIPEALSRVSTPLHWIHFGGGSDWRKVEMTAASLPEAVKWEIRGQVSNQEVLDFYRDHHVAAFVSLSESEGIPVSFMEAQSFGIPIVATGITGIPEIVTERTGLLLDPDARLDEIAAAIKTSLAPGRFDRDEIIAFFNDHFEASKNHAEFADKLIALGRP